jgi:hypothetical protein
MSDNPNSDQRDPTPLQRGGAAPTTQQMRTVGQRRREAEQKLDQHLDEARRKNEHQPADDPGPDDGSASGVEMDASDIAAIQNDDSITPADRVDLIANQAIPETDNRGVGPDKGDA